jgi:hypothetical protein
LSYAYNKRVPTLENIFYMHSPPLNNYVLSGSQNWHLDRDQSTRIKVLWSPTHQVLEDGPTMIIPNTPPNFISKWPNYPAYIDDSSLFRTLGIGPESAYPLLCGPDYFWLVDTSRLLHCGSRNFNNSRTQLFVEIGTYYSRQDPRSSLSRFQRSSTVISALNTLCS